jgi:hypothetical protein
MDIIVNARPEILQCNVKVKENKSSMQLTDWAFISRLNATASDAIFFPSN